MSLGTNDRLKLVEERRRAAEATLWQLPSVSIAAQAFLLTAGLDPEATDGVRILVGALGIVAAVATGLVVAFQGVRVTVLTRWLDQVLDEHVAPEELCNELGERELNWRQKLLLDHLRTPFWPWGFILAGFFITDVLVMFDWL